MTLVELARALPARSGIINRRILEYAHYFEDLRAQGIYSIENYVNYYTDNFHGHFKQSISCVRRKILRDIYRFQTYANFRNFIDLVVLIAETKGIYHSRTGQIIGNLLYKICQKLVSVERRIDIERIDIYGEFERLTIQFVSGEDHCAVEFPLDITFEMANLDLFAENIIISAEKEFIKLARNELPDLNSSRVAVVSKKEYDI